MRRLTIAMLGEPRVHVDDRPVVCPSKKALGLFLYLAQTGSQRPRRELARLFWGADEAAARTSLRTALQRLPQALLQSLAVDREGIGMRPEFESRIELDTSRFAALAKAEDVPSLTEASQLYGGDLLKNLDLDAGPEFDDWLHRERARFRQIAQSVFDRLITRHRERAQLGTAQASAEREAALATARRWTTLEPSAESAHRWLMRLFFEAGQRDAALAQFEVCQRELAVAIGRAPDAQTRALFDAIAAGGPQAGTGSSNPPPRAPGLDAALRAPELANTSFVGRIDELASLDQLLSDPACRLLTLHALGGMGKSRLAFALANQVATRFALGATWIALDALQSADHLPHAVASAIGIELAARAEPGKALCAALRAQERLLVLDNFEHLIEGGAVELVLAILREAPQVRLLVTSREVLGVHEEWIYEVPGLALAPAEARQMPAPGEFPAVELFMQRARQAYFGFSPQAEWPHVARICRLVGGLPLALELAAAWVRTIPCGDLAQAIENEMATVASRHRNRPARHHSLDAVVRTSWSLLAREQQHALAPLSMFVGGFTQEAAHAVADASLRVLSTLVDKALVNRRFDGRMGLHPLVRQFLQAQLATRADAMRQAARRFVAHFAAQLSRLRAQLDGPAELEAEAVLGVELPNLMAAAAMWGDQAGDFLDGVAEPMLRVLIGRGMVRETVSTAKRMLETGPPLAPATRALLLAYRGRASAMLGDMPAGQADLNAAIELGRKHRLGYPLAYALVYAQALAYTSGELDAAQRQMVEAEPLIAEVDDPALAMRSRQFAALVLDAKGRPAEAEHRFREALALATRVGSPTFMATVQSALAAPILRQGRLDEGEALLRESLLLFERIGSAHNVARVLNSLALVALWRAGGADAAAAARDASRAVELFERTGYSFALFQALDTLGQAMAALGQFEEARRHFERAATVGTPTLKAEAWFHLALLELEQRRTGDAIRIANQLLDVALAHGLDPVRRWATLLSAAIALRLDPNSPAARRWLHALLADPDLDFDLRRRADTLLAPSQTQAVPANDGQSSDLMDDLREFLRQQS
jgi:predicted ATPase/DNA-binding SARP family transcriptional activator